ncbi:MAG: hypothetical protein EOS73_25725 [Mesorhizobium sp.]|uniref:hypothetical protein n=1 Tax=Mesorhizobium sp. M7A.F.Ca.ET.027.02.1.1 TaxID=2496655 RepID=UPI000FD513E4|nr:hypothetical protein [Mesorhizobium sp. M7A.F.Ca.ET.027.02.1.1]RVD13789.1 hypothetical protein EN749_22180 [Mesorhizobium sp. M7A.F.Ca.ET.027.02.1.1]RWD00201.1 MAG: hypothetical protein EOS73_25725 [Mesorhizobium sp.]
MSTRGFIGLDGSGVPMVKIMADASYDPLSTPDTDWEKHRFNSRNTEYSYIDDIIIWPRTVTTYYPAGRNSSNYVLKCESGGFVFCHAARAIAYYGFLPIIEHRYIDPTNNKARIYRDDTLTNGNPNSMAKVKQNSGIRTTSAYDNLNNHPDEMVSQFGAVASPYCAMSIVTRFPCDRDYTALSTPPVSGNCFFVVDEKRGYARISRGAVDARTAIASQCIVHEDQRPLTIVATGSTTLTAGQTQVIALGVDVPDGSIPYIIGAAAGNMAAFSAPSSAFLVDATISGNNLTIFNGTPVSITVFYNVMVQNQQTPTTGGSGKILYTDEGEIKMLRPGAASPPVPADILLWSEYRYCPVVAYGKVADTLFSGTPGVSSPARTYTLSVPALDNPPIILTALQKIGADATFNDGDILINANWTSSAFGVTLQLTNWWVYDATAHTITFSVNDTAGSGWVFRYFVLAVPD